MVKLDVLGLELFSLNDTLDIDSWFVDDII